MIKGNSITALIIFILGAAFIQACNPAPDTGAPDTGAASDLNAADDGRADLDKATQLHDAAKTMADLENVIGLCESALKKGLDEESTVRAEKLLITTLYQHAQGNCALIFRQPPDPRWQKLQQDALADLEKVLQRDDQIVGAHILIARLNALPGGDREKSLRSLSEAVRLAADDKQNLSKALVLRAALTDDAERKLADYKKATELDPLNEDAFRMRGAYHLQQGQFEKAAADFRTLLEKNADNVTAHHALADTLARMNKDEQALEHLSEVIRLRPDQSFGFTSRAQFHVRKNDVEAAVADLDEALAINPQDSEALLLRAQLRFTRNEFEPAREDVNRALELQPGLRRALVMRSLIDTAAGNFEESISDLQKLLRDDPKNTNLRLQLANVYATDKRPHKAVDVYNSILTDDPKNYIAQRGRANMMLGIGKHAEAISDFEILLKQHPEDTSVMNNLAWLLATSPDDNLRNGQRSVELATKACEVTEYKVPNLLGTLAAAYAEIGDFETAVKWSAKGVEMVVGDEKTQWAKELESYQKKKPVRDRQQTEEKPDPTKTPDEKLKSD